MKNDLTTGSIWKKLLLFALPIMGGNLLQLLYSVVDGIVVGNFVSEIALGSINTSLSFSAVLLAISTGLSTGMGIIVSQYFGAKQMEDVRRSVGTGIVLLTGIGLVLTVVGWVGTPFFLRTIMGVPEEAMGYAVTYLRIYFLGMIFQFLYNAFAAALRSVGDSSATLLFLMISSVTNVVLDLLFVIAFKWDVAGVAIATVLSQGVSVVASVLYTRKKRPELTLDRKVLRMDGEICRMILKMGVPVMLQTMISSAGSLCINRLVNSFGTTVMSAVAAGGRIEHFALMPAIAFNAAMSTFAGQNMGAGDVARVKRGYATALAMGAALNLVLGVLIILFARPLVGLFGCTGETLEIGVQQVTFMAKVLVLLMVLFASRGMIQGAGDVTVATVITFVTLAFRVFIAYYMASIPAIGYKAIWYSMGLDFAVGTVLYMIRLASGKWKNKAIVKKDA